MNTFNQSKNTTPDKKCQSENHNTLSINTCSTHRSENSNHIKREREQVKIFVQGGFQQIYNLAEKDLMGLNNPQIPTYYFRQIHSQYKKAQALSTFKFKKLFQNTTVVKNQTTKWSNFLGKRDRYINHLCKVNFSIQHRESIYTTVYLFDRLNQLVIKQKNKDIIPLDDIYLNCCVAIFTAGNMCQIYPYSLQQIKYIMNIQTSSQIMLERQSLLFQHIDWKLNPVSEYEFFNIYRLMIRMSRRQQYFCQYLIELGLGNWHLMQELPNIKAIAVLGVLGKGLKRQDIVDWMYKFTIRNQVQNEYVQIVIERYRDLLETDRKDCSSTYKRFQKKEYECASELLNQIVKNDMV